MTDAWSAADRIREVWWDFVDTFHAVRSAFKGYVRRVQSGGSTDLTDEEKVALELRPPSIDKE